jgi:hypothetical protein
LISQTSWPSRVRLRRLMTTVDDDEDKLDPDQYGRLEELLDNDWNTNDWKTRRTANPLHPGQNLRRLHVQPLRRFFWETDNWHAYNIACELIPNVDRDI